jgi:ABC-type Fe3+/spermidine/putrescine transport system ATPase subunit
MSYIEIRDLKKSYGKTEILKGLSLSVESGEFISLLGPSGSGKTTLLRCIAGLETADAGSFRLAGEVYSDESTFVKPEARGLGMVFQNYAVWPHLTVAQNVAFPFEVARRSRLSKKEIQSKTEEALKLVRLDGFASRFPHELSGGQQQRVALARALALSPRALLLDEPLSNLDAVLREELGAEIRRLQQELKLTTVLVTHDRKEALSLSDRIIVLNQGKIEAQGTPEELFKNPPTDFVAAFLAGGQVLKRRGEVVTRLPHRWKTTSGDAPSFKIVSRLFLGNEYEYWAENAEYDDRIRFFAGAKFAINSQVGLVYSE